MWDAISIIVGILVGIILAIVIFSILWSNKSFIFSYCPNESTGRLCLYQNYWNDPGNALAESSSLQASDILYLNGSQLEYKRQPKSALCVPDPAKQVVPIPFPQYCSFTTSSNASFTGKSSKFDTAFYTGTTSDGTVVNVFTKENCVPIRSETNPCPDPLTCNIVTGGTPLVQWDPNTRFTEASSVVPAATLGP